MEKQQQSLLQGYQNMLERIGESMKTPATLSLQEHLNAMREKAVQLDELSREEAVKVSDYLQRDVLDAAEFLADTENSLSDWMRFDLALIEDQLLDMFSVMVDQTQIELQNLAEQARYASEWMSGEICAPGTLVCTQCGHELTFHKSDYIPPCPNCNNRLFQRQFDGPE